MSSKMVKVRISKPRRRKSERLWRLTFVITTMSLRDTTPCISGGESCMAMVTITKARSLSIVLRFATVLESSDVATLIDIATTSITESGEWIWERAKGTATTTTKIFMSVSGVTIVATALVTTLAESLIATKANGGMTNDTVKENLLLTTASSTRASGHKTRSMGQARSHLLTKKYTWRSGSLVFSDSGNPRSKTRQTWFNFHRQWQFYSLRAAHWAS